jgi:hypothetical protein
MSVIEGTVARRSSSLRRLLVLFVLSIPAAAATVWDEVLLAGPIMFLVQALGFTLGLVSFIAIWAAIGLAGLLAVDIAWPHLEPLVRPLLGKFKTATPSQADAPQQAGWWWVSVGMAAGGAAVTVSVVYGNEVAEWVGGRATDLGLFAGAAIAIFMALIIVDRVSRGLELWVRTINATAAPALRFIGALVAMVVFGPVLGWPVFRLLGYRRRSTYALTVLAAPLFGGLWVPFYGLGIWGLIQSVV